MSSARPPVLFDLDGVISDTASVHAKAWAAVFDDVLKAHGMGGQPFRIDVDYRLYVDGKMRQAGIESFLASRGIALPLGVADQTGIDTVNGIGNTKNVLFRDMLTRDGVVLFDDATRLIARLLQDGFVLGIASSSKNARPVLEKAGLLGHFAAVMDGVVAEREQVESKPSPEFYRHAAGLFCRPPQECVVIEDAISGIVSAKAAGIKLVIGIAREDNADALRNGGADIVVGSLDQVSLDVFRQVPVPSSAQKR